MNAPLWVPSGDPGEYWAHFARGAAVRVRPTRTRRYPGLHSIAPDTSVAYRAIVASAERHGPIGRVLDVGMGAGLGLAKLAEVFPEPTGLDSQIEAVAFAREWLSGRAEFVRGNAEVRMPWVGPFITVVDVLGAVGDPLALLRNARRHLEPAGRIAVVEPEAHLGQELKWPVRRAFTAMELRHALESSGFEVVEELQAGPGFVGFVGQACSAASVGWLERGERERHAGNLQEAKLLFSRAVGEGSASLAKEARLRLAALHDELGETVQAVALYLEGKKAHPHDPRPRALLARLLARLGRGYEALELARGAVELDPCHRLGMACLAEVADTLEHGEALEAWKRGHALAPDSQDLARTLAERLEARGEAALASSVLARAHAYH